MIRGMSAFFHAIPATREAEAEESLEPRRQRIGYLGDIEFDTQQAALTAIVVYGRPRFFGLFGRENDCVIPWSAVKTIGEDAVLVDHIPVKRTPKRSFLQNFFENG